MARSKKKANNQPLGPVFIFSFILSVSFKVLSGSDAGVPEVHVPHVSLSCHSFVHLHFTHKIRTKQYQIKLSLK